jgi:hypothetical protein
MRHRIEIMNRVAVVAALAAALVAASGAAWAQQDDEDEGPISNMHFVVVRDFNGKPIRNAAVVLHPVTKGGKQAKGGMELKTNDDGKASIDGIPYGPLRVQVLAPGFQTYGEDFRVNKADMEVVVRLKRPTSQYSIYGTQEKDKKADPSKTGDPKAADSKPADGKPGDDKPADAKPPQ